MSPRKTRQIIQALEKKGFKCSNTHHKIFRFYLGTKGTPIRTRISHGIAEYSDGLLGQMARQLKLTGSEFAQLIECPMDYDAYAALMLERRHL